MLSEIRIAFARSMTALVLQNFLCCRILRGKNMQKCATFSQKQYPRNTAEYIYRDVSINFFEPLSMYT